MMLNKFISEHNNEKMELHVLEDNEIVVCVYRKMGFTICASVQGYSISDSKPNCLLMERL